MRASNALFKAVPMLQTVNVESASPFPAEQTASRPTLSDELVDLRDPLWLSNPRRQARGLRARARVHRDVQGLWLLLDHADCRAAMQSAHLSRDPRRTTRYAELRPFGAGSALEHAAERFMLFNDAPTHTRLRRVVGTAFKPSAIRLLRDGIEQSCRSLMDGISDDKPFDFMASLAQVLPIRVICDMLGIEAGDFEQTKAWSDAAVSVVEPLASRAERAAGAEAVSALTDFLRTQVARRRARPGHTVLDLMIAAQSSDAGLDDDEMLANLILLFIAGHETTTNLLGNGLLALLQHPQQWAVLRDQPEHLATAIDEMLRWDSPVNMVARTTVAPWQIGELQIPAGDVLYCMIGAAHQDPSVFADPQRFDVCRQDNPQIAFGGGVHYCVGAPLAMLEAQIAFEQILARWPSLVLADPQATPAWRPMINLRGLKSLQVRTARA